MLCASSALYMMAHVIYAQVFGYDVLPVGEPWIKPKKKVLSEKCSINETINR